MDVLTGTRVVRGPNWTWGEQDGGEGHVGTVVEVLKADRSGEVDQGGCSGPCVVTVQWDCGNRCRYRCGVGDRYDLRVLDSAPAGVTHHRIMCNICGLQLTGIRWKCIKCYDCDLCTLCYMSGKHELDHEFDRMDMPRTKVRVPTRATSKKKEARGIYPMAEVVPGRDWNTAEENGDDLIGIVQKLQGSDGNNSRGFAEVEWKDTGKRSVHRVGDGGKVELKCVESSCISYYYPDHLTNLGSPLEEEDETVKQPHDITSGDHVRIELDPEVFRAMHEEQYGWTNFMLGAVGTIGTVKKVLESGDLKVMYPAQRHSVFTWTICADAVVKIELPSFSLGDLVCVNADLQNLETLQGGHEHNKLHVSKFLGRVCRVIMLLSDGHVLLEMRGKVWYFHPLLLSLHNDVASLPWSTLLPQTDDVQSLRTYLQQHPDQVNKKVDGRTALHCAAADGDLERVKLLLELGAVIEIEDNKNNRALHYCCMVGTTECGEELIGAGADVNAKGSNESTPLILAANGGHIGIIKVLLKHSTINIHEQDAEGNTVLHLAVLMQQLELVSLLLEAGADPSLINFRLYNPFIEAARFGSTAILECMIEHNPEYALITSDFKYTALHTAAYYNHMGIVPLMVEKGKLDINSRDDINQTPLHVAVIQGSTHVVEELVSHGADVNVTNNHKVTPLHALLTTRDAMDAPTDSSPEIMRLHRMLLGKVPDNLNHMFAPITTAAFLLSKGADMHIIAENGNTAFKICPYLATLMTVLAENGDLLANDSHYSSNEGILSTYGTVPYLERKCHKCGGHSSYLPSHFNRGVEDERDARMTEQDDHYDDSHGRQAGLFGHGDSPARVLLLSGGGGGSDYVSRKHISSYDDEAEVATCFLCDSPANVRFHPCGHSVMCSKCAARAKKCPTCRGSVHSYTVVSDYY